MASEPPLKRLKSTHKKLTRLPPTHHIQKRPLLHPSIPSPRTNATSQKIIYISTSSPFIAIIKRVRKLLDFVEGRSSGDVQLTRDGRGLLKRLESDVVNGGNQGGKGRGKPSGIGGGGGYKAGGGRPRDEEVQLRATGRAIQKALQIAVRLQGEVDLKVRFETASVGAVDDVVEKEKKEGEGEGMDVDREEKEEVVVEESRVRRYTCQDCDLVKWKDAMRGEITTPKH